MKILLAVDGSKYSLDAVDNAIEHADWYREKPEVELLTVHLPVPKLPRMNLVVGKNQIERYYREEGETIAAHAKKTRCDLIFVGTHGRTATENMVIGSIATKVLHISPVPVLLVR